LYVQYVVFMKNFWHGEALKSLRYNLPVLPLVLNALGWTLVLVCGAMSVSVLLAIPLGTIAALKRGSLVDVGVRVVAVFGQSMPSFWVAMLLMLVFAVHLRVLPVSGLGWQNAILPMATLAFFQVAVLLRLFRSELLEVIHQEYIRTARAKGLRETRVVWRHAFKNAAIPVVTMVGLQCAALVAVRGWVEFARVARGQALAFRERDYILAVRALGANHWRIVWQHILTNTLGAILVVAGFQLGALILLEASISFLGIGIRAPTPAWGSMLSDARNY
jgi:ABC-type dipeptide/oligopeptide/nickel transport system permease component